MRSTVLFILFAFFASLTSLAEEGPLLKGSITVEVNGLRNNKGEVRVNLYDSEDGFPSEPEKAVMTLVSKIDNQRARVVFKDIHIGNYAISVLHDENGNEKVDLNWLMIPKEGIGASNNPNFSIGPPGFNDAKFRCLVRRICR